MMVRFRLVGAVAVAILALGLPAGAAVAAPDIVGALTAVAHTGDGRIGVREVGSGTPLVMVMGFSGSIDYWAPSLVDLLARHHRVIVFDNAGIGRTTVPDAGITITAMAEQTSALITQLRLRHPAVLGWSMGGMIAQALAVLHPDQVGRLVLAATQAGTRRSPPVPSGPARALAGPDPAAALAVIFPHDQSGAEHAYLDGILRYRPFYTASARVRRRQTTTIDRWIAGRDATGRELARVRCPTLVADGTEDELDPTANAHLLATTIHGARLTLYADAGHAFLFQDANAFARRVDRFLSQGA
jgi:pimeloyl-ACP methyl ester carboxylesterase